MSGGGKSRNFGLLNVFKCIIRFNPFLGNRGKMLFPKFLYMEKNNTINGECNKNNNFFFFLILLIHTNLQVAKILRMILRE